MESSPHILYIVTWFMIEVTSVGERKDFLINGTRSLHIHWKTKLILSSTTQKSVADSLQLNASKFER